MANDKEIHELAAASANLQDTDVIAAVVGTSSAKKYTGLEMRAVEKAEREAQDNTIEASSGLETDGSFLVPSWNYINAAELTAQGEGNNLKASVHLLDTQLKTTTDALSAGYVFVSTVTLTNAQILSLHITPITLDGGIDIGKWNIRNVIGVSAINNHNGTTYSTGGGTLQIKESTGGNVISTLPESFIEATADESMSGSIVGGIGYDNGGIINVSSTAQITGAGGEITIAIISALTQITL